MITPNTTDTQAIVDVATRAAAPARLDVGHVYNVITPDGRSQQIDLTGEQYLDSPKAKRGTTLVRDVDSFLSYFEKHSDEDTELYADLERRTVTAVLDAHTSDVARWGRHRLQLELRHTTGWLAWTSQDGALLTQKAFADFIEDNLVDLVEPDSATMLELAESFQATSSAEFQSSQRLDSGQRKFSYVEDVQAKAGHRGDVTIPSTIRLALRPFEGTEPYAVTARFKYRLDTAKGELKLGFKIERPGDVLAAAFSDVRDAIDGSTPMAVLNGAPIRA